MALRVAYLTHYAEAYGANRSLLDLVIAARDEHAVVPHVILATDGTLCRTLAEHGIAYSVIPFAPWMHKRVYMGGPHHRTMQWWRHQQQRRMRAGQNKKAAEAIERQCRAWDIHLLHINSAVIGLGPALSKALDVPWVWHIRELPFHHYAFHVDGGLAAYADALRNAHGIVAVSKAVQRDIARHANVEPKIRVIYDAVFSEERRTRLLERFAEGSREQGPFTFILTGLFHASKGQMEAVEAMAALRTAGIEAKLLLVGGGRDEAIKRRVEELALQDHVSFMGFVDPIEEVLLRAHCALTCSRHEAYGRATVEALAAGLPVIGHASGGTVELIAEGSTGYLYTTQQELVDRMARLARSPLRAAEMGEAARLSTVAQRTIHGTAADIIGVYWTVLGKSW